MTSPSIDSHSCVITTKKLQELYAAMLLLESQRQRSKNKARSQMRHSEACIAGLLAEVKGGDTIAIAQELALSRVVDFQRPHVVTDERSASVDVLEHRNSKELLLLATGVAVAARRDTSANVVVAFSDAKTATLSQNAVDFALARKLPIIYVVAAQTVSRERRKAADGQSETPLIPVDQNDVVAIYRVASEAIAKARRGVGPTIIQSIAPPQRAAHRQTLNGPQYLERYLQKKGLWSEEFKSSVFEKVAAMSRSR